MMNMKYQTRKTAFAKESQKIPRGPSILQVPLAEAFATVSEVHISAFPWQSNERQRKKNRRNIQQQKISNVCFNTRVKNIGG